MAVITGTAFDDAISILLVTSGVSGFPTSGADTISALDGNDTVNAAAGADSIHGGAGDDSLLGDAGNDTLNGGGGSDTVNGGDGNDLILAVLGTPETIIGGAGNDTLDTSAFAGNYLVNLATGLTNFAGESFTQMEALVSGAGSDTLVGTAGANTLNGGGGSDTVDGGAGNDSLLGGDGNDTLNGGGGSDTANGGAGDDLVFAVIGTPETIIGGAGIDTLDTTAFGGNYAVNLATGVTNFAGESFTQMENIVAGIGNDTLVGTGGANVMNGGAGNDSVNGDLGADSLLGGDGNDTLNGGGGADTSNGGAGDDLIFAVLGTPETILGGSGVDTLDTTAFGGNYAVNLATGVTNFGESFTQMENIVAGIGNDTLTGTDLGNVMEGGAGNDSILGGVDVFATGDLLLGGDGNDTLRGDGGHDTSNGGAGDDFIYANNVIFAIAVQPEVIIGGAGIDTLVTTDKNADYLVNLATGTTNFFNESFTGMENVLAGGFNDTLIGSADANYLSGGAGSDSLDGGAGNDTLYSDTDSGGGLDTLLGGAGNDEFQVQIGAARTIVGGTGTDTLVLGFAANFALNLATGATNVAGQSYTQLEDVFSGGGADTLGGTAGANRLEGNAGADSIIGGAGLDTLLGGAANDRLNGGADNDVLDGGAGTDTLTGGAGVDLFRFTTVAGNDRIADFVAGVDEIQLDDAVFTGLPLGALGAPNLVVKAGAATNAPAGTAQVIYDTNTGGLWFDADGIGGIVGVRVATLAGIPALLAGDIVVI